MRLYSKLLFQIKLDEEEWKKISNEGGGWLAGWKRTVGEFMMLMSFSICGKLV